MLHIDLFSGIGGFSYAADHVWPNMDHLFCDIDSFARAVTKKHWPESTHYENIYQLIADAENGKLQGMGLEWKQDQKTADAGNCHLVTGGFPCQPFSQAGRRRGTEDDRYLWPAMFRVIQLAQPTWVIAENVSGLVTWSEGMVLEQVCADLEGEGYEVQPFIIPAVSVNAPHRRDRVWIVANRYRGGYGRHESESIEKGSASRSGSPRSFDDSEHKRLEGLTDTDQGSKNRQGTTGSGSAPDWSRNWVEVATELCGVDDGLPARVDGLELSKSSHRRERIKSLGNAIVPQVAMQIMMAIRDAT